MHVSLYVSANFNTKFSNVDFRAGSAVKNPLANAGDVGLKPWPGRSSTEGNGTRIQYFHLENPMDGGAWRATIHGVTKSQLSDYTQTRISDERQVRVSQRTEERKKLGTWSSGQMVS